MDIFQIHEILSEICKRKNWIWDNNTTQLLYPDILSSLEAAELLLTIDRIMNTYYAIKFGLNDLTVDNLLDYLNAINSGDRR